MKQGVVLLVLAMSCGAFAGMSSTNYDIAVWTLDGGGQGAASTHYSALTATAQSGVIGVGASTHYTGQYGIISQQYEALPPSRPEVHLEPAAPTTTDPLVCYVDVATRVAPGLPARYEYAWSNGVNTVVHGPKAELMDTLDPAFTLKNQTWTCSVRGYDGRSYSATAGSDSITTVNTPPGPVAFTIPTVESTSVNLRCYLNKSADPDGDVVYSVQWYVKHEGETSFSIWTGPVITTGTFTQIDTTHTNSGDTWYVHLSYWDDEVTATEMDSPECRVVSGGVTSSYVFMSVYGPPEITLGEPIILSGQIVPRPYDPDRRVYFHSTPPAGAEIDFPEDVAYNPATGTFTRTFYPTCASEGRQDWMAYAHWNGDSVYSEADSATISFVVRKAQPSLSLSINASSAPLHYGELTATATFSTSLPDALSTLRQGNAINLYIRKPDGSVPAGMPIVKTTNADGKVTFTPADFSGKGIAFDAPGMWKFIAVFEEDDNFYGAASYGYDSPDVAGVTIKDRAGYAILVLGKLDENAEGQPEHAKTLDYVYQSLRDRGFAHEDIYYLREGPEYPKWPSTSIQVDDTTPTQAGVQWAITSWAQTKINETPAPLYIVFLDHGSAGAFYLYAGTGGETRVITPAELNGYMTTLQAGLSVEAHHTPVIFIYGGCHSGSFVPAISGQNRTIIASCLDTEVSHRGVIDPADGIRDGEVFITELFRNARQGKTFRQAFETASDKTSEYTFSRSNGSTGSQTQHPVLDDNGDQMGTSGLLTDELGQDGGFVNTLTLGYGVNAGESVGWITVPPMITLAPGDSIGTLEAKATENSVSAGHQAWIEIKTPDYAGSTLADLSAPDYQLQVDMNKVFYDTAASDLATGCFRWQNSIEGLFDEPGAYKVFYYIQDGDDGHVSSHMLTTVYRQHAGNQPPSPVALVAPLEGATVHTSVFFAWEPSTDPDGDAVTYWLEVCKDNLFVSDVIKTGELHSRMAVLSKGNGLQDLTTYYWRVIAMDEFGATSVMNEIRSFTTDDDNDLVPGYFMGVVRDSASGAPLGSASISIPALSLVVPCDGETGEYYFKATPRITYGITAAAAGYQSVTQQRSVSEGAIATLDFALEPEAAVLGIDPAQQSLGTSGGTCSFHVMNNGSGSLLWTASVIEGGAWLQITSGFTGSGPGTISLSASANPETSVRTGTIQITAPGASQSPTLATVIQAGNASSILNITPLVSDADEEGETLSFTITNAGQGLLAWTTQILSGTEWLHVLAGASGTQAGALVVSVDTNPTPDLREGVLQITAPDAIGSPIEITIRQQGDTTPFLSVSSEQHTVSCASGTAAFSVENAGNGIMEWTAAVLPGSSWLQMTSNGNGTESGIITLSYSANSSQDSRTGLVRVAAVEASNSPVTVLIIQEGDIIPTLMVSPLTLSTPCNGGEMSIAIENTGHGVMNWTALLNSGAAWMRINSGAIGTQAGTVSIHAYPNPFVNPRTGSIQIESPSASGSPVNIPVAQAPDVNGYWSSDWIRNPANGHYYRLFNTMRWAEAHAIITSPEWNASLTTVNDAAEDEWIFQTFGAYGDFFLGLYDTGAGQYQWINGESVAYRHWSNSGEGLTYAAINGETGTWYTVNSETNRMALAETETARINVTAPVGGSVEEGDVFIFQINVRRPVGDVNYQWLQNTDTKTWSPIYGANDAVLIIDPVRTSDAGDYACIVSDGSAAVIQTESAHLTVLPAGSLAGPNDMINILLIGMLITCYTFLYPKPMKRRASVLRHRS